MVLLHDNFKYEDMGSNTLLSPTDRSFRKKTNPKITPERTL
jgi:hypothetical protein